MTLPRIINYGRYDSDNYGSHTLKVDMGNFNLYYSYETIVAYSDVKDGLVCIENSWDTTTGKHLNWIEPNKKLRKSGEEFDAMLKEMLKRNLTQTK